MPNKDIKAFAKNSKKIPKKRGKEVVLVSSDNAAKTSKRVLKVSDKGLVVSKSHNLDLFMAEFVANGGNATQAAAKCFNIADLGNAARRGYRYLKRAKECGRVIMEKQGYGMQKMIEVAAEKMEYNKDPAWWDRLMKMADYGDFISKPQANSGGVNVNVFQAHKDFISDYVEGEVDDEETVDKETS